MRQDPAVAAAYEMAPMQKAGAMVFTTTPTKEDLAMAKWRVSGVTQTYLRVGLNFTHADLTLVEMGGRPARRIPRRHLTYPIAETLCNFALATVIPASRGAHSKLCVIRFLTYLSDSAGFSAGQPAGGPKSTSLRGVHIHIRFLLACVCLGAGSALLALWLGWSGPPRVRHDRHIHD